MRFHIMGGWVDIKGLSGGDELHCERLGFLKRLLVLLCLRAH